MKRRILIAFSLLLLGMLVINGLVVASEIDVNCFSGEVGGAIRELINDYEEEYPDRTVNLHEFPSTTSEQRMWMDFASGANMYDITIMLSHWFQRAYEGDNLVPLNDYIESDSDINIEDYADAILAPYKREGNLYGIPVHDGPMMLFYRKDLIEGADEAAKNEFKEEYGWELDVPETWNELLDVGEFFHNPDEGFYGIATNAKEEPGLGDRLIMFMATYGEDLFDDNWRPTLDESEAVHEYFDYMRKALEISSEGAIAQDADELSLHFLSGRYMAMMQWTDVGARVYDPEQSKLDPEQVGYAMIPKGEGEDARRAPYFAEWASTISKDSDNPDAAYHFISWLSQHDREMLDLGAIACRKSTLTDPEVLESQPYLETASESHEYVISLPPITVSSEVRDALARMISSVLSGGMSEEEGIEWCQKELTNIMQDGDYLK